MKNPAYVLFAVLVPVAGCVSPAPVRPLRPVSDPVRIPAPATPPTAPPDLFASGVRPVLAARCTPCHEPGGRMYPTMPFDSPGVVAGHRAAILRRLKDPAERRTLEEWLATLPPG